MPNADARQLHDRATRGQSLTAAEQEELARWYAEQDASESAQLSAAPPLPALNALRTEVEQSIAQLRAVTEQIQHLTVENVELRREVGKLQLRLTDTALSR